MANTAVANTILQQLGGNKFITMTGAKNFFTNGNDCCFSIGKNCSKANRVKIILNGDDTYTMQFIKFTADRFNSKTGNFTPAKAETLKEYSGVYCDMLQDLFTSFTGLYTHL